VLGYVVLAAICEGHDMDEGGYIIKPKDPAAIIRLQDPTIIEEILENPLPVLAEIVTGYIQTGNGFWAGFGARLAQAAFKGRVFEQFGREFKQLQEKGKIPENFTEKKLGYQSWVELLMALDTETPDEERLEALKAMFYAVNKIDADDAQRFLAYQLFQISKRLTSGELILLRTVFQAYSSGQFHARGVEAIEIWCRDMAGRMGHGLSALVMRDQSALEQEHLITARVGDAATYVERNQRVNSEAARITDLGKRFCENINEYQRVLKEVQQGTT
jgi:hypothetical protein